MISNTEETIDSREIIERIEELQGERESWLETSAQPWPDAYPEEAAELAALEKLAEQASAAPDWRYGEILVRESYFTDYIRELIDDCYEIPIEINSGQWPWRHMSMDYEAAAADAQSDYIDADFNGVTYFIRG